MDRRDFLKLAGLGGLALTLPKPLEVVAARMSDLKGPPLHVGYGEVGGLGRLTAEAVGIAFPWKAHRETVSDLGNWRLHVLLRKDARMFSPLFQERADKLLIGPQLSKEVHLSALLNGGVSVNFAPTDVLEFWAVPEGPPQRTFAPFTTVLATRNLDLPMGRRARADVWTPIRSVRLDRARALELGLVGPEEPYETF